MRCNKPLTKLTTLAAVITLTTAAVFNTAIAAENQQPAVAFPDTWMIRAGAYIIERADTSVTVLSDVGLGSGINFKDELGGEDSDTVPRIDAYYRFNEKHRIDFTTFSINRTGRKTLDIDLAIGDEVFTANEALNSDIKYTLYRLGYGYSFYRSPEVELSVTAGLNVTQYDLKFDLASGDKAESAGFTAPLPAFGLRMGYAITPKWSVNYVAESFFIEIEDTFKGGMLNYELSTEYKLLKNFALGAGFARITIDADINDNDWGGRVTDSYRGFTLFGTLYF